MHHQLGVPVNGTVHTGTVVPEYLTLVSRYDCTVPPGVAYTVHKAGTTSDRAED